MNLETIYNLKLSFTRAVPVSRLRKSSRQKIARLREELRPQGIRVIALLPGATDTPIWDTLWPEAPRHKMMRTETVARALVAVLKLPPESTVEELDLMPTAGAL